MQKNILLRISKYQALKIMVGLLMAVLLFHFLIVLKVIPSEIVWAGKLKSVEEMYVFESVSILVNLILLTVLLMKGNFIKHKISEKILNGILWFFVLIFALNTIGNLLAKTLFERTFFTALTFVSCLLIWIIVRKDKAINS